MTQEWAEKRKHIRIPFIKGVKVGIGMRRSLDLSVGGMYLETVFYYPVGTLLDLQFKLHASDERPLQLQAEVVRTQEGVGAGLRFLNVSPEDHEKIQKFIDASIASPSKP